MMNTSKSWIILLLLIILLYQIIVNIKHQIPNQYEIENFPLIRQPDGITCGPICIQMILKFYGKDVELKDIRKKAKTDIYAKGDIAIGGTCPEYEEEALGKYIRCKLKVMDISDLKRNVSKNKPVLAVVRSGVKLWHWVVVIGYTKESIIIANPGAGVREIIEINKFDTAWGFSTDLDGTDCTKVCKLCKGSGYWWKDIGPLGKCDLCSGSGKLTDWYAILAEWGELKGHMAIEL